LQPAAEYLEVVQKFCGKGVIPGARSANHPVPPMVDPARQAEFAQLCDANRRILAKVAFAYCRNLADRQDLLQEIAVQAWRSFDRFDGRAKFSTWLYRVALNVAISFRRRERTRSQHVVPGEDVVLGAVGSEAAAAEQLEPLRRCIDALEGVSKALLVLHLEGHDHQEIGAILGFSVGNVGTRMHRLKQQLREQLQSGADRREEE